MNDAERDALLARLDERSVQTAEALRVALAAQDKRLEGMNEFRDSMNDLANRAVTRQEYEGKHADLIERLDTSTSTIREQLDEHRQHDDERFSKVNSALSEAAGGRASLLRLQTFAFSALLLIVAVGAFVVGFFR